MDEVVRLAVLGGVKKLYLFHHDPSHDDARIDAMLAHARSLAEGQPLEISPPPKARKSCSSTRG